MKALWFAALPVAAALISLVWTPYPTDTIDIAARLLPPSAAHLFGTDPLGRDLLSLVLAGARTSLLVSLVAVVIGAGVGVPLGLLAASARGVGDGVIMRANDLVFAFPALITAIMLTALAGPSATNAAVAIGIFNVPVFARLTRGGALPLLARDFTMAARAAGKSPARIGTEHILPNLAPVLVVQATIQFALGIVAESGLAYIGLGAPPPAPSWGRTLAEAGTYTAAAPWLAIFPGLAIVGSVLAINAAGSALARRWGAR